MIFVSSRHISRALRAISVLFLISLLSGCFWFTSRRRGEDLETQSRDLATRVERLEKQLERDRQDYTKLIQKAERDVAELEAVLGRATSAAADYAADTNSFRDQLAKVEGSIAELRNSLTNNEAKASNRENDIRDRLELVAEKVGLDPPLDPALIPQEREKLMAVADEEQTKNNYGKSRSYYRAFIERFPTDELADDAQLKIGQTYLLQKRYAQALTALNVVVERYPQSDQMGETLYTMAESLYKMRSCNDALTLLQAVLQRYRDESLVNRARSKLREVQRSKREGCRP